jgi:hypothetical protein
MRIGIPDASCPISGQAQFENEHLDDKTAFNEEGGC